MQGFAVLITQSDAQYFANYKPINLLRLAYTRIPKLLKKGIILNVFIPLHTFLNMRISFVFGDLEKVFIEID